jgi:hypothetical protein
MSRFVPCELRDLKQFLEYFRRADLLSTVDAASFVIMKRARIRLAYAFDYHFAVVGFSRWHGSCERCNANLACTDLSQGRAGAVRCVLT